MMKPKEKAIELCSTFLENVATHHYNFQDHQAKQCALLAVDEIIKTSNDYAEKQILTNWANALRYWQEVKEEIEKL